MAESVAEERAAFEQHWNGIVNEIEKNPHKFVRLLSALKGATSWTEFFKAGGCTSETATFDAVAILAASSVNRALFEVMERRQEGKTNGE